MTSVYVQASNRMLQGQRDILSMFFRQYKRDAIRGQVSYVCSMGRVLVPIQFTMTPA